MARCYSPRAAGRGVVIATALLSFVLVSPAFAWEVMKSSNGVVVMRSPDDTAAVTVMEYYSDKPQANRGSYVYGSSYNSSTAESTIDLQTLSFEWPLDADEGYHMLTIKRGGTVEEKHVVYREPLNVKVTNTSPIPTSTTGTATVTIPGTLQVDATRVGPLDSDAMRVLVAVGVLAAGVVTYRKFRHG